jgi:hypothetical protein
MRFALALPLAMLIGVAGCKKDPPKDDETAQAATADATATAEPTSQAEEAAAAVGERTMERTKVSRSRETVRSDAPKTKAVVGN